MAKKNSNKPIDITQSGPQSYRDLQKQNAEAYQTASKVSPLSRLKVGRPISPVTSYIYEGPERSSMQQDDYNNYWGASHWDDSSVNEEDYRNNLGDIRAEKQPWYSKIVNGLGKAGVLAVTTAAEAAGLVYGIGQGIYNAANAEDGEGLSEFVHGLWDNPITQALKAINDASEKWMPNYYTRDEQENPLALRNIFSANTLGDKLLKNTGFMVGAFYGGLPAAAALGKAGTALVKSARASALARAAGEGQRVAEAAARFGNDIAEYNKWLSLNKLTSADRAANYAKSLDKIRTMAGATRATTQAIGALGSAINEGAIEAINNSEDWAKLKRQEVESKYRQELQAVENKYKGTEMEVPAKVAVRQEYEKALNEIEKGKAKMGNADLLLNIPILTIINAYELGKLYSRGFNSTRMRIGNALTPNRTKRLEGSLKDGTLKSNMSRKKGVLSAVSKSLAEGTEEYLQRAASDGSGSAVDQGIDRYLQTGKSEESKADVADYITSFGKAIADNLDDESAWDEFFVGLGSSLIGMPVFGRQTRNAYIGKNGPVGLAGGLVGNYNDYTEKMKAQQETADYLNKRVKDPKFKKLYETLRKTGDYDKLMEDALNEDDKKKYKDLEFEKMFEDIYAAATTGHLDELKELIGYNKEYDEKELHDIMMETSQLVTAKEQKQRDEELVKQLQGLSDWYDSASDEEKEDFAFDIDKIKADLDSAKDRIEADDYIDKREGGPFINVNGEMDTQYDENGEKGGEMRRILERNKNHLLDAIDNIERIRNAIDIESDGRLSPEHLKVLTQMRAKMWDMNNRSVEMAQNIMKNMSAIVHSQKNWQTTIDDNYEKAQNEHEAAKKELEEAKKNKKSTTKEEKRLKNAEEKLLKAKRDKNAIDIVMQLLDALSEEKETTASERAAFARGYGEDPKTGEKGILGRIVARMNIGDTRGLNADELQAYFRDKRVEGALLHAISKSYLSDRKQFELSRDVRDLGQLARDKMEYNTKWREFMGDPSLINEAFQRSADRVSQQERDNKTKDLALSLQDAKSFTELDSLMRDANNIDGEIAKNALQRAKEGADDETKAFFDNYEKGSSLFSDVMKQLRNYDGEAAIGVSITVSNAWEEALASDSGDSLYDKFLGILQESSKVLRESGNHNSKEEADIIDKILSDLGAAKTATTTSNKSKHATSGNSSSKGKKPTISGSTLAEGEERKPAGAKKPNTTITKEDLKKAIGQEILKSKKGDTFAVDKLDKVSQKLKNSIDAYNKANPNDQIDDSFFDKLYQDIVKGEYEADDSGIFDMLNDDEVNKEGKNGAEQWVSDKADAMSRESKESFKSDYVSEFEYNRDFKKEYTPNPDLPNPKQLKRVQELLKKYGAYDFVDKNLLGYIEEAYTRTHHSPLPIYFLRSTDTELNTSDDGSSNPVIFAAIELDDKAKKELKKHIGNTNSISTVTIDGKEYVIVGTVSINAGENGTAPAVRDAFSSFQHAVNAELDEKTKDMTDEDRKATPFVKSDKLSTTVRTIFTGRLEKREDETSGSKKQTVKALLKSFDNSPVFFGIALADGVKLQGDTTGDYTLVSPNAYWMNTETNMGSILMYLPRPDGKYYPLVATRRTVGDWLNDGGDTLLNDVLNGDNKNEYIKRIVDLFNILLNSGNAFQDRMKAKQELARHFLLGKRDGSKQAFYFTDEGVYFRPDPDEQGIRLEGTDNSEKIKHFFDLAAKAGVAFSLSINDRIASKDIIDANILEINLVSPYSFNANFTINSINGDGDYVETKYTGPAGPRPKGPNRTEFSISYDGENHTYYLEGNKVYDKDGNEIKDKREIAFIRAAQKAEKGELQNVLSTKTIVNREADYRKEFLDANPEYNNVYVFKIGGETWIYDGRQATKGDKKIYRGNTNSKQYQDLRREINKKVKEYNEKIVNDSKALEELERKKKKEEGSDKKKESKSFDNALKEITSNSPTYLIPGSATISIETINKEVGVYVVSKSGAFLPVSWNRIKSINDLENMVSLRGNPRTAKSIREVIPGKMEEVVDPKTGKKYWKVKEKAVLILDNYDDNGTAKEKESKKEDKGPKLGGDSSSSAPTLNLRDVKEGSDVDKEVKNYLINETIKLYESLDAKSPVRQEERTMRDNAGRQSLISFINDNPRIQYAFNNSSDIRAGVDAIIAKHAKDDTKGPQNNPPTGGNTEGLSEEALTIATKPIEKIDENDNVSNSLLAVIGSIKNKGWMQDIYAVMQTAFNSGRRPGQDGCPTEKEIAEALTAMKGMKKERKTAKADLANKIKGCKH